MFDLGSDDVITFFAKREEHSLERKIIGLATAAREDDLLVLTTEQRGDLATRYLKGLLCPHGGPMSARRIAVMMPEKRPHRRSDRRINRRAGVVVEINAARSHDKMTFSASIVAAARSAFVLRRAPARTAESARPRTSMQVPHTGTLPLAARTRLNIRSML